MTPVSELPFNVRPKSRKEKNKLASRCDDRIQPPSQLDRSSQQRRVAASAI
ncbi:hypothetical protein J6590_055834 [Homalodisca vitripennis]|nr:hypothetical protein J6590_055834 [Homalodisca vitripennis]